MTDVTSDAIVGRSERWGDPVVVWSEAVIELLRWRERRCGIALQAERLVCESEQYLLSIGATPPRSDPA